jgi:hypothetical protein
MCIQCLGHFSLSCFNLEGCIIIHYIGDYNCNFSPFASTSFATTNGYTASVAKLLRSGMLGPSKCINLMAVVKFSLTQSYYRVGISQGTGTIATVLIFKYSHILGHGALVLLLQAQPPPLHSLGVSKNWPIVCHSACILQS